MFQMEIQPFGDNGKFRHIFFFATGVAGDEVGNELLAQTFFMIDPVEYLLEFSELAERRFAHNVEHTFRGMLRGDFEPTTYVAGYEFTSIFLRIFVDSGIFALM